MATLCLIHGAWHGPSCWDALATALRARDHEVVQPDLPLHDSQAGYEQRIRPALEAIDAIDHPVLIGHSQGSNYATLVASARQDSSLIYLCPRLGGFDPPAGAPKPFRDGFPFPANRDDGTSVWSPEAAIESMYPRLGTEIARNLAEGLRPMAPPPGEYPLAEHPEVPTALIYGAEDELFEPSWQLFMAAELLGIEAVEFPSGHFPMAEDPAGLADLLDRTARELEPAS